jgi:hypothetical protein
MNEWKSKETTNLLTHRLRLNARSTIRAGATNVVESAEMVNRDDLQLAMATGSNAPPASSTATHFHQNFRFTIGLVLPQGGQSRLIDGQTQSCSAIKIMRANAFGPTANRS